MKDKDLTMTVTPPMSGKIVLITGGTGGIGKTASPEVESLSGRYFVKSFPEGTRKGDHR